MRPVVTILAVAACLPLAACGADPAPTPADEVRATLEAFTRGVKERDYAAVCERVLDPTLVGGLEEVGLTCPQALEEGFAEVRSPQLSVDAVEVDGTRASARVRTSAVGQATSTDTVRLIRTDAGWRVTSLGSGSTPGS